jgi:hypothetical protein
MNSTEQYFKHTDGGLYRFVAHARSADSAKEVVVYEHLWPFDPGLWVRDRQEFEDRFLSIALEIVQQEMRLDRAHAQATVTAAKAARRAKRDK